MKITINNEEVLCDKDFTINEEMLNTSSTILNNVYPATWEQDKDYTSRFYYPKDYSKCKIFDEIVHPTTREDVEGTSFSINVDTTKQYQVQTLKGQTTQSGTPTPTSPQPINITTGRQVVSVCKTNKVGVQDGTYTLGNLTFSITNGVIEFNGTTDTATRVFYIPLVNPVYLKNGETNTFYVKTEGTTNNQVAMRLLTTNVANDDNSFARTYFTARTNNTNSRAYTQVKDQTFTYLLIQFNANQTINFKSYIQLNGGSSVLDYEEYKGNDYEINLGKNLWGGFTFNRTINGIDFVANENGTITANGTATGQAINISTQNISANSWYKTLEAGTYTLSVEIDGTYTDGSSSTRVQLLNMSGTILTYATPTQNGTLTITQPTQIWVRASIYSGGTAQNITFKPQLEKGDATSYSPYKTPIYLGKIGTYQDYIFKNTTENHLYDSNLEEGQWYIHKEIGRVVLNGTQANPTLNTSSTNTTRIWYNYDLLEHNAKVRLEGLCNRLTIQNNWSQDIEGFRLVEETKQLILRINKSTVGTTVSSVNTWLSNNNVIVYYIFETPTNTLIEDEELINQLNSIELLDGLNNVSVSSPYLPFIMSLMYNYQEGYTEEDMLFCGVVENTGNISLNPREPHYCNLQVLDFKTFLSEGETLDFVIYEKTIEEAIDQVIGVIQPYGFIKGNVNILHGDDVIGAYSTKDKTAYDVFNYLADITQSRWTTRMIDENTVAIDFYDPSLMPQGTAIEYNNTWFCNNNILDMSFSYSSRDYRNKQVMLSGEVYANIETTEVITADGYQTQFNTTDKIGYVSSIAVNGTPATIITKDEYELGYEGDFIYQSGNAYFESENLVSTGSIITIVYYAVIEGREVLLNQVEVDKINSMTNRKGVIARYETRNDATTTQELNQIGQSYLKYKGSPEVSLKVSSTNNIWNIGERVEFTAPLDELTTEYMVKKKTINYITTQENIFYTYELSSSFNSETEINYFDNQRAKTMGNIGVGEFISRNIDIENTANVVFYDLEVNEVELGDNTLQSELQTTLGVE